MPRRRFPAGVPPGTRPGSEPSPSDSRTAERSDARPPAADGSASEVALRRPVLVVMPEEGDRAAVADPVRAAGRRTVVVADATHALAALAERRFGVIVADLALGREALRILRVAVDSPTAPVVVALADRRNPALSAAALRLGVDAILARPVSREQLGALLAVAGARDAASTGPPGLPVDGQPGAGSGPRGAGPFLAPGLRAVFESIPPPARACANILIAGEPGSGRTVLARAFHAAGSGGDLAVIECRDLATPGASSSANELFRAWVERVSEEPMLFRHVEALPAVAQDLLERRLRADEEPGGAASIRTLATADPSIDDRAAYGKFRAELFARLAIVRIDVPPLRARPDDVPVLAERFLDDACARHVLAPKSLTSAARALLAALPWRGNARELRLLAERLALMVPRAAILLEDVLAHVRLDGAGLRDQDEGPLRAARERFERDYLAATLARHQGRIGEAAAALGLDRTALYRKLRRYGLAPGDRRRR